MEYLVSMTTHVPDGTPQQTVDDVRDREAARSRELAAQGHLLRLWRVNGARSGCSPPPTAASWSRCSPRCRCECGAPTR